MFKKTARSFLFSIAIVLIFSAIPALAQDNSFPDDKKVDVYFFWAYGCPHCNDEKPFLEKLEQKYSGLEVHSFEVTGNKENADLLKRAGKELNASVSGVPFTVVGDHYFSGWYNEQTTGAAIEEAIQCALQNSCYDTVGNLISPTTSGSKYQDEKKYLKR